MIRPSYFFVDYIRSMAYLAIFSSILIFTYKAFVYLPNRSWGMMELSGDEIWRSIWTLVLCLPIIALCLTRISFKPSDIFMAIYSFIVVLPFLALNAISGVIDEIELLGAVALSLLPLLVVFTISNLRFIKLLNVKVPLSSGIFYVMLFVVFCLSLAFLLLNAPTSAGINFVDSYVRRFEARETFPSGSFGAYVMLATINSILPYMAFKGISSRLWLFVVSAILGCLFFFWLSGNKSQFLWVAAAMSFGAVCRADPAISDLERYMFSFVKLVAFILALELVFLFEYSILSDLFLRRLFMLSAQLQGYYYDAILSNHPSGWSWLNGGVANAPFFIGEHYLGRSEVRANSSGFIHFFLEFGIVGYVFTIICAALFVRLLDALFTRSQKFDYSFVAFLFSLLITEQKVTIVLLSSGILGLIFLVSAMPREGSVFRNHVDVQGKK